jgi:alkylated DNA repair protein alkB family protein 8
MGYHVSNGEKEHFLFTRPHNQDQTDVLMLSPTFQATEVAILQLFKDFGATKVTSLPPNNSPSFVEFTANETTSSIALAATAKQHLSGVPCPWNPDRPLLIKFAKRTAPPPPPPPPPSVYTGTPPAVLSSEECHIPGLLLIPNFISKDEQTTLLSLIDSAPWEHLAKRRVQHWGKNFKYDIRGVDPNEPAVPFPPQIASIASRIENIPPPPPSTTTTTDTPAVLPLCPSPLDQLTVNEYSPGVGLAPHVDTHSAFEGAIVSLSLAGPTVMVLRKEIDVDIDGNGKREEMEKEEENRGIDHQNHNQNHMLQKSLFLPPRSLLILGGEARYAWQHYIPHRKSDEVVGMGAVHRAERRVSLTFRKINTGGPCQCRWPEHCDSQGGGPPPTRLLLSSRKKEEEDDDGDDGDKVQEQYDTTVDNWVEKMEGGHVQNVYEAIAPHFSATRFAIWPKVKAFIDSFPPGSILADVGCGNGKYFGVRRDIFVIGSDRSPGLAGVASQRLSVKSVKGGSSSEQKAARLGDMRADVFAADGMHLPFKDVSCDGVLCIAVLHHISSVQRRVQFLEELRRILKPGGRAVITVWVSEQSDQRKFAKWKRLDNNSSNGDTCSISSSSSTDYFVPWNIPLYRAEAAAVAAAGTVDRQKNTVVFQRYYHLFNEGELEELIEKQVEGVELKSSVYDADNWVVEMVREEE